MSSDQLGFWDVQDRLRELSAQGDSLEKLAKTVDFELFRAELTAALGTRDLRKGGRPAFDPVLKFRMLVLQALHGQGLEGGSGCRTGGSALPVPAPYWRTHRHSSVGCSPTSPATAVGVRPPLTTKSTTWRL